MFKGYVVDGTVVTIGYPEGFTPADLTDKEVREVLRRTQRHSDLTWLRDVLYNERIAEKEAILTLTGDKATQIRFRNPNAFLSFADEEVEWDLETAYQQVPGLKTVKDELSWWEASAEVSFSAKSAKEFQLKLARLKKFLRSIDGSVVPDSPSFTKRYAEQVIRRFCTATMQAFPWSARQVTKKTARWFDKLPGKRIRLRKGSPNAPGQ